MYQSKDSGGLNIVNIEYKLYALRLKHIQECSVPSATSSTVWTISASAWVAVVGI
jgi:hypothetical protein